MTLDQATRGRRNAHETDLDGDEHPLGYSRRWWLERQPRSSERQTVD